MPRRPRSVELTRQAERDYDGIVKWTAETFGPRQAGKYEDLLLAAIEKVTDDPLAPPSRSRDEELEQGFRTLHVARPGWHLLLYRVEDERVLIVRILHDSMELSRHAGEE